MSSIENTKKVTAVIIVEVLGKPAEHLTTALGKIVEAIEKEKGTKVLTKKINKPTQLKNQKEFFTTYAEIEIEVEEILYLAMLMFKYMPAHIEIISPEIITSNNNGWNEILNELTRRLHGYDEVARVLRFQNDQMQEKLKGLIPEKKGENEKK